MATRSSAAKNSAALDPALPQKKRARRRLVGAAAIALAAAIVLPLVLDSEPRQVRDDVQVSIPSRDTPLNERTDVTSTPADSSGTITPYGDGSNDRPGADGRYGEQVASDDPGASDARADAGSGPRADVDRVPGAATGAAAGAAALAGTQARTAEDPDSGAEPGSAAKPESKPDARPAPRAESKPEPKAAAKTEVNAVARTEAKTDARSEEKSEPRTLAKLEPSDPKAQAAGNRPHLLQVGAFSTVKAASEQAGRVQKLGVKTYTERIQTSKGERIRVRIGPFATREAADRARAKLKSAGIDSALVAP